MAAMSVLSAPEQGKCRRSAQSRQCLILDSASKSEAAIVGSIKKSESQLLSKGASGVVRFVLECSQSKIMNPVVGCEVSVCCRFCRWWQGQVVGGGFVPTRASLLRTVRPGVVFFLSRCRSATMWPGNTGHNPSSCARGVWGGPEIFCS